MCWPEPLFPGWKHYPEALCFGPRGDYSCCCRRGWYCQRGWTVNPSWPYSFGEIYEGWIDGLMFTPGLIYLIQDSIQMHRGLFARRHHAVIAVLHFMRSTLKNSTFQIETFMLPRGHTQKKHRSDAGRKNLSPVCVLKFRLMLSPWLTLLFSFLLSSCLLGRDWCGHFPSKVSLNTFPLQCSCQPNTFTLRS